MNTLMLSNNTFANKYFIHIENICNYFENK